MAKVMHHHITKLLESSSYIDPTVDVVYQCLLKAHHQYKLSPEAEVRDLIAKELQSFANKPQVSVPVSFRIVI